MMLSIWLNDWLTLRKDEIKPRTIESYQDLIDRYIVPEIGAIDTDALKPEDIRHLLAQVVSAGHTRTAELLYVMLKCALSELDNSPMGKIKRPKHHQQSPEPWSDESIAIYLAACETHPHGLALSLGLLLGLRRGEICGLRWQDIDMSKGTITITNQRVRLATGEIIDTTPKSLSSVRSLPIPDSLRARLNRSRGFPSAYVCSLTPSGLDSAHRRLVAFLGLPSIPLHGLRHSMASASLRHGGDMRAIQAILGHASYATTANIYAHPDHAMLKTSLELVLSM